MLLQADIKCQLATLKRAEILQKRLKKKGHLRTQFYKNLLRFVKDHFTKEKSGILNTPKQDLEEHLKKVHQDTKMDEQIIIPHGILPIQHPEFSLDTDPDTGRR